MEGGDNMNKQKYLISSISMILMLFLVVSYQAIRISGLSFLQETSSFNDLTFITVSVITVLLVSLLIYYLPMLLVFEVSMKFNIALSPKIYVRVIKEKAGFLVIIVSRRYLRLNVIRC